MKNDLSKSTYQAGYEYQMSQSEKDNRLDAQAFKALLIGNRHHPYTLGRLDAMKERDHANTGT